MYVRPAEVQLILARSQDEFASTAASLSTPQLEEAIKGAEAEVNSRLAVQYVVPFAETPATPPLVSQITRDIAAFLADLNYRQDTDYTSDNEPMLLRYRRAQELLGMLVDGSVVLTGVDVNSSPESRAETNTSHLNPYQGQLFGLCDFDLGTWPGYAYPPYPLRTDYFY
jgi:phage gp36-like protein